MSRAKGSCKYDHDRILALYRRGLSQTIIAKRIGCTRQLVGMVVREHEKKEGQVG